jgi:tagatose 1,6-diphosphate aldolase
MKKPIERLFCQLGMKRQAMYRDELIHLIPRSYAHRVPRIDGACSMIYDIADNETNRVIGEIALRLGEGEGLFYLGHIGYHIDPPYQGKRCAYRACVLCLPVFRAMGMNSFVITTDEDNLPSIHTCERLGCVLESTVDVPFWCQKEYEISSRKRRYVFTFSKA